MRTVFPKIDLVLSKNEYIPGETVKGSFQVKGGITHLTIHRLECDLMKQIPGEKAKLIQPVTTVLMNRKLDSKEETVYPFHFSLPQNIKEWGPEATFHLQTKLVLSNDIKTTDMDIIHIQMNV
ncbi:sporulation protein [Halobacillus litoralis]|uniref:sporulation protein n=1 Tax=Halobacillus litoralis TaxID=45668 RepID=UPI001CFCD9AB|nr:sporulation protein [Halobacillus litoralis]